MHSTKNRISLDSDQWVMGIHAVQSTLEYASARGIKLHIADTGGRLAELKNIAQQVGVVTEVLTKMNFKERFGDDLVHQGAVLKTHDFPYVNLNAALENRPTLCVVLDGIEDPRNLGRAARSAFALGAELLIIPKDRAAQITATAEKAAVGALARLPVTSVTNLNRTLEDLKKAGLWIIGSSDKNSIPAWKCDLTKPIALVVGNEEKGLRKQVAEHCDESICIPMTYPEFSLNAADAVTVLLAETSRQRMA